MVTLSTFNVAHLNKGDFISSDIIRDWQEDNCPGIPYDLARLQFKSMLEERLRKLHSRLFTITNSEDGLSILTDSEAASYNPAQFSQGERKLRRSNRRLRDVDQRNLSPEERKKHDRDLEVQGKKILAIKTIDKIDLEPAKRKTPGLV